MFKKNAWIAALFLAVAIVFTGCLDPLEEESTEGLVDVVLLDLAPELKEMPVGAIANDTAFGDLFGNLPINPAGNFTDPQVKLAIVDDGGKNVLDVTGVATWGAGVDIDLKKLTLKAGDTIYIKGKLIEGGNFFLNKNPGAGVAKINEWEFKTDGAAFETTQALTAGDLAQASGSNPPAIRLRANGQSHFVIEQLKIVGKRAANEKPGPTDDGYKVPENGEIKFDSALNMYYFYVDLNTATPITNPPTNFSSLGTPPEVTVNSTNIKLTYSGSANDRPTVSFAFGSDEKVKAVYNARSRVVVEWNISGTAAGGNYRFSIGNIEGRGGSWNAMSSLPNPISASIYDGNLPNAVEGDNPNTQGIVLQQMGAPRADELTVRSIKVSYEAPKVINAGAIIDLPPTNYGNLAFQTIETAFITGKVIQWKTTTSNVADFDYKSWDTGKKYPLFKASTNYIAVIQITAKAGYLLDGWSNGMPMIINGADTTPTNVLGQNNYSFNSNNNTITVQLTTGATAQNEWTLGDLDDTTYTYSTTNPGFVIYDSAETNNRVTINYQDAGCTIEQINKGYNVTNRGSNDWRGLDIIISGLTPATKRYKITVLGVYIGLAGNNVQVQLGQGESPYSGLQWSGALDGTNKTFTLSQEIPEDWFVIGAGENANRVVRVNTTKASGNDDATGNAGMYNSFRVSRIIIEDLNLERIRIGALTGITVTAPVLNAALPAASSVTGQPAGTSVTGLVWKKGADTVTGNFGADTAYTAEITIRAPNTHTFTGFSAGAANANLEVVGTDTTVPTTFEVIRDGRSITIKATFEKTAAGTPIVAGALSVTKPVINVAPSTSATGGSEYTLSAVTWSPTVASNFLGDTAYTATVTLTATGTNTFTGLTGDFTVADAVVTKEVDADGRTCKISAAFPKTDAPALIAGSNTITITAPVIFAMAATTGGASVSGTDLTTTTTNVSWTPTPINGAFVGGVAYTASVTVSATAITKTLTGATAALFSAANGGTIVSVTPGGTLAQSTAVVTVSFPATAATAEIGSATISIVAPVGGQGPQQIAISATPNVIANTPIVWKDSTGAAITGNFPTPTTGITAEFTVTTAQYYAFKDATITVTGGTVTPAAGSVNGATVAVKVTY
jgi:hypothetical protein